MSSLWRVLLAGVLSASIALSAGAQTSSTGGGSSGGSESGSVEGALCTGDLFNPMGDPDWNNVYPITIAGVKLSGKDRSDPPLMTMPPVCVCPSYFFGMSMVGVGITYWHPSYLVEIEYRPGCSSTLGGTQLLKGYGKKRSEEADEGSESSQTNLKQIHWYEYPIFSLFKWFADWYCHTSNGYNLLYMTEIDPTWNDDEFGVLLSPESTLFANPIAQAACIIDAVAANVWYPLDPLFWCAGSWGGVYPLSGNAPITNGLPQVNNLVMSKFIARNARLGLGWQTIGPTAQCNSHPNPIWIKSQFRINQVGPLVRHGDTQAIGDLGLLQFPPTANYPGTGEYTANLLWQGQQCCAKIIP